MDLGLLDSEEIRYELLIRGMDTEGSIRLLAGKLKRVMQEESEGSRKKYFISINTPSQEYEICEEKIKEMEQLIQSDKKKTDFMKQNKAVTKGEHVMNILDTLQKRAPELKLKSKLGGIIEGLIATNTSSFSQVSLDHNRNTPNISLESLNLIVCSHQTNNMGAISRIPRPQNNYSMNWGNKPNFRKNPHILHVVGSVQPNKPRRSQDFLHNRNDYVNNDDERNNSYHNSNQIMFADNTELRKLSNISKWNVKFNGLLFPISVEQFIMRVEIIARSESISLDNVCLSMHHLLTGIANDWFWVFVSKNRNITWNTFRCGLINEFQTLTRDHEKSRESFTEFKLTIESMNTDLRIPYSDSELVSVLMNNMHPGLKKLLVLSKPVTLNELRIKCLEVEKMPRDLGESYDDQLVARRRIVNEINIDENEFINETRDCFQVEENNLTVCWNCDDIGHSFQDCPSYKRNLFCYSCGYKNVTKPNCPRCRNNLNPQRGVREQRAASQPVNQAQQNRTSPRILQRPVYRQSSTQTYT